MDSEHGPPKKETSTKANGPITRRTDLAFRRRRMEDTSSSGISKERRLSRLRSLTLRKDLSLKKRRKKIINNGRIKSWEVKS
jgi:hypothetical protein